MRRAPQPPPPRRSRLSPTPRPVATPFTIGRFRWLLRRIGGDSCCCRRRRRRYFHPHRSLVVQSALRWRKPPPTPRGCGDTPLYTATGKPTQAAVQLAPPPLPAAPVSTPPLPARPLCTTPATATATGHLQSAIEQTARHDQCDCPEGAHHHTIISRRHNHRHLYPLAVILSTAHAEAAAAAKNAFPGSGNDGDDPPPRAYFPSVTCGRAEAARREQSIPLPSARFVNKRYWSTEPTVKACRQIMYE